MTAPMAIHKKPWPFMRVSTKCVPDFSPTQDRNKTMPNSRRSRLAFAGMYHNRGPIQPIRLKIMAVRRGPPANPSRRGAGMFPTVKG